MRTVQYVWVQKDRMGKSPVVEWKNKNSTSSKSNTEILLLMFAGKI